MIFPHRLTPVPAELSDNFLWSRNQREFVFVVVYLEQEIVPSDDLMLGAAGFRLTQQRIESNLRTKSVNR